MEKDVETNEELWETTPLKSGKVKLIEKYSNWEIGVFPKNKVLDISYGLKQKGFKGRTPNFIIKGNF